MLQNQVVKDSCPPLGNITYLLYFEMFVIPPHSGSAAAWEQRASDCTPIVETAISFFRVPMRRAPRTGDQAAHGVVRTEFALHWPGGFGGCHATFCLQSGWGSDGNIYNVLRGLGYFLRPSGA